MNTSAPAPAASQVEAYLAQQESKELLRFVAVGSVDDGKSTLIGRLLHDTHGIYEDQLAAVKRASERRGSAGDKLDLSLLTDGLKAEREQGITIDVAYRYFSTEKRKFIIADTPGHVQYTRNMATGASTANVALILIDARAGVLTQSRCHATIASLLGIPHLLVCVNKMDLVDFRQEVFDSIKHDFEQLSAGLRFNDVRFVPISAIDGDNVVHSSERTPWYAGETVLGYLESVPVAADRNLRDLRFPVQYVLRPHLAYRGFCGQIAAGVVKKGDAITVLPSEKRSRVKSIDTFDGPIEQACAPMSVTLLLEDEIDISRGDMIVHTGNAPTVGRRFAAHVVWMSETPLDPSRSYYLKHTTRMVRATVDAVLGRLDLEALEEVPSDTLELNDIGRLALVTNQPLFFDPYTQSRPTGSLVLVDELSNNTVGAGMIIEALDERVDARSAAARSRVPASERRARFGHRAALVAFAVPAEHTTELAYRLEEELFARGCAVTVIDVLALQDGTRSPALLADVAEQCLAAGLIAILSGAGPRPADRHQLESRVGAHTITLQGDETVEAVLQRLMEHGVLVSAGADEG